MQNRIPGWVWLPVGIGLGLAAARLVFAPHVLERWPAPGAAVPATAEIRITFDQAMDEASVLARLHVGAVQEGEASWEGFTLIYRPWRAWASGTTVEVRLDRGAQSASGLATIAPTHWSFTVSQPRWVYLWPAHGTPQVYARARAQAEALPLTSAPGGVTDFSIGTRGTRLAYVAVSAEGSPELREIDLVRGEDRLRFACPAGERCTSPVLSPDGSRMAFVRAPLPAGKSEQGISRVWLLEEGEGDPVAVSPEGDLASSPLWSPQGWLSFTDTTRGVILVVDAVNAGSPAPLAVLPSSLGERGAWSPDGELLIYPDLMLPMEQAPHEDGEEGSLVVETHLFAWDVSSGGLTDLTASGGWQAEDVAPTFAADGEWVIFSRRLLAPGGWTPGRQLWRMRPDGSQAERLSDNALINHGAPAAGPQGMTLAYLRFDLEAPDDPAQIWWFDADAQTGGLVIEGGYLPAWIP